MRTLKNIFLAVLDTHLAKLIYRYYILYLFRGKKVYYVSGMRRSGNHAFINWLTNSLENKQTNLIKDDSYKYFLSSPSHKTIFFNEVNEIVMIVFLRMIYKKRNSIRKCDSIIISVEDCSSFYTSYKIPRYDKAIYIKRSLLNLVASRLEYLIKRAKRGRANYWSAVDHELFNKILSFENSNKFYNWEFEKWLTSKSYRETILKSLNLTSSTLPELSNFGGGSSFTGTEKKPDISELINRYKQVKFSKEVVSLLKQHKKLLYANEIEYLNNLSSINESSS